jgi:hypothetical protein
MPKVFKKGKSGVRKYGRNKIKCLAYRKANKRYWSKKKRLEKHLEKQPRDKQARVAFNSLELERGL